MATDVDSRDYVKICERNIAGGDNATHPVNDDIPRTILCERAEKKTTNKNINHANEEKETTLSEDRSVPSNCAGEPKKQKVVDIVSKEVRDIKALTSVLQEYLEKTVLKLINLFTMKPQFWIITTTSFYVKIPCQNL